MKKITVLNYVFGHDLFLVNLIHDHFTEENQPVPGSVMRVLTGEYGGQADIVGKTYDFNDLMSGEPVAFHVTDYDSGDDFFTVTMTTSGSNSREGLLMPASLVAAIAGESGEPDEFLNKTFERGMVVS